MIVNKHLMKDLQKLGLYNETVKNNIIRTKGSIQQLLHIPEHIRRKYKIVWEMSMKSVINMAKDRGAYICQSQSMNLWQEDPTYTSLTSILFLCLEIWIKNRNILFTKKSKTSSSTIYH